MKKDVYELVFANRGDRTIEVSKAVAKAASYVCKSGKYIEVTYENGVKRFIVENGIAREILGDGQFEL